jgi:hypothetical protein
VNSAEQTLLWIPDQRTRYFPFNYVVNRFVDLEQAACGASALSNAISFREVFMQDAKVYYSSKESAFI